jgi:drug/metabolite transporter (DMT)-like permease
MPASRANSAAFDRAAPIVFVLLWSTGWIVARFSADYADPLTFLCVRFAGAALSIFLIVIVSGVSFPKRPAEIVHAMISGVLLHAIYLGGVWWAVRQGLPASISALIAAVQPIATAILAPFILKERTSVRRLSGVALGLIGLTLVLSPKLTTTSLGTGLAWPIVVNVMAMLGATAGFFYQKHFQPSGDLRAIAGLQYIGALIAISPFAAVLEPMRIEWNLTMALVLVWSVLALSIGAIWLLLLLIRHGEVSRAAQLIYLVPPTAAAQAYFFFGEDLSILQVAGMAVTAAGVAIANRR